MVACGTLCAAPSRLDLPEDTRTAIPAELPGLELRTMDKTKIVQIQVDGRLVEVEVPLFVYVPTESTALITAARRIRRQSDRLADELVRPNVSRATIRQVAEDLDSIIADMLLEAPHE